MMRAENAAMKRWEIPLGIAATLLFVSWRCWELFHPLVHTLQPGDTAESIFLTDFKLIADYAREGIVPFWNPHTFAGFPLFASPHAGFFYPLAWLSYALSWFHNEYTVTDFKYYFVGHIFFQAVGMFFCARAFRLSVSASIVAAVIFASLPVMGNTGRGHQLSPIAWWPLATIFFIKAAEPGNRRAMLHALLGGGVMGLSFLASPGPETLMLLILVLCLIVSAGLVLPRTRQNLVRLAQVYALGAFGFITVAALQFLPLLQFIIFARRFVGPTEAVDGFDKLSYSAFTSSVFQLDQVWGFIDPTKSGAVNATNFIGIVAAPLLVVGIGCCYFILRTPLAKGCFRHRLVALFAILLTLFCFLAMFNLGLPRIMYFIPGLTTNRHLSEYMYLAAFGVALLSAIAVDRAIWPWFHSIIRLYPSGSRRMASFARAVLCIGLCALFVRSIAAIPYMHFDKSNYDVEAHYQNNFALKKVLYPDSALRDLYRIIPFYDGSGPRYNFNVADQVRFFDTYGLTNIMLSDFHHALSLALGDNFGANKEIFDLLNIRWLLTTSKVADNVRQSHLNGLSDQGDISIDSLAWGGPHGAYRQTGTMRLFENRTRPGYAWVVSNYDISNDSAPLILDRIAREPGLLRRTAIVSAGTSNAALPLSDSTKQPVETDVTVVDYKPNHIRLRVHTNTGGILVVSEIYYPGWSARIGGSDTAILKVNGLLRGIPVPKGVADVEMIFRPFILLPGVLGWLMFLGTAIWLSTASRRRKLAD